jgi:hypothetical protein
MTLRINTYGLKKQQDLESQNSFLGWWLGYVWKKNDYRNSQMCIVTGPNIDIAIKPRQPKEKS